MFSFAPLNFSMDKKKQALLSLIIYKQDFLSLSSKQLLFRHQEEKKHLKKVVFLSLAGKLVYFPVTHKEPEPKTGKKTTWEGQRGKVEEI